MLNWREVPFFRILSSFILGILAYLVYEHSFSLFNYLLIFLTAYLGFAAFAKIQFRWQWLNGFLIGTFFFLLGYQVVYFHNDWNDKDHFRTFLQEENLILGIVNNAPQHNERSIQIDFKIQQIGSDINSLHDCSGKVSLYFRNDTTNQEINYGDLLVLKTSINAVKPVLNPEAFDFKKYLHFKNIHYQGFLKSDEWKKLESGYGNPVLDWAFKTRTYLISVLKKNIKSENEFAVASALILGYKNELTDELKNAYANTGAMHVLAVSGLHAGLIWGIIAFILKWIRWKHPAWNWIKTGITILGLWMFALITGASPSVLRAATMFSFLLMGTALNRNTNIYNTLAASAFCLLLFNPYLIAEVGFQLSYFAVIGIVYFYKKIYNLWYIENPVGDYLWRLSAIAISAQLMTFPMTMYYFHQFPAYFLLSGLVVVPVAFLILGLGIAIFSIDWLVPFLSATFAKGLVLIIWLMNAIIFLIEQLPTGFFKTIWIGLGTMLVLYILVLGIIAAINLKQFKYLILSTCMILLVGLNYSFKTLQVDQQKSIVFFHISGKTHVEFVDGDEVYSFGDDDIKEKQLRFATQNYHLKNGLSDAKSFYFENIDTVINNFFLHNNLIQFYNKKIAFVKKLPKNIPDKKLKVDFLMIQKGAKINLEEIIQFYEFKKLIIDGSLRDYEIISLKKEVLKYDLEIYDINREGAYMLDLN